MSKRVTTLALIACACATTAHDAAPPARSAATERDISLVLDGFHAAAARADETRYFGYLADDSVFLGTDASERWTKSEFRAYAHPHFARGKAWSFRAVRRTVSFADGGDVAWFDEDLATEKLGAARGSGVLVRRAGRWSITQYNLALTVPNDRFALVSEAAATATVVSAASSDALARLAWLAGAWIAERAGGEIVEEHWMAPGGATMIGSGRTTKAGKTTFFEHLRIEARDGRVVYAAQPLGRAPTEFVERAAAEDRLVFENRSHDWPKRITYERREGGVSVRVEGDPQQRTETWTLSPAVVSRSLPRAE